MPLRHFRDKSKRRLKSKLKPVKILVTDYPLEVWINILSFVEEADRRKMSVSCSYFNALFRKYFIPFIKLPLELIIYKKWCSPIEIFRHYNNFTHFGDFFQLHTKMWNMDQNLFKITGPNPHFIYEVKDVEYRLDFDQNKSGGLNLSSLEPFTLIIKKMVNCVLWYTKFYEGVYYVPGCSFMEIDFAKVKKISFCHQSDGVLTQLTNLNIQDPIIHREPIQHQERQYNTTNKNANKMKKNKFISVYSNQNQQVFCKHKKNHR